MCPFFTIKTFEGRVLSSSHILNANFWKYRFGTKWLHTFKVVDLALFTL